MTQWSLQDFICRYINSSLCHIMVQKKVGNSIQLTPEYPRPHALSAIILTVNPFWCYTSSLAPEFLWNSNWWKFHKCIFQAWNGLELCAWVGKMNRINFLKTYFGFCTKFDHVDRKHTRIWYFHVLTILAAIRECLLVFKHCDTFCSSSLMNFANSNRFFSNEHIWIISK